MQSAYFSAASTCRVPQKNVKKMIMAMISGLRVHLKRVRCTPNLFRSPDIVSGKCLLAGGRSFLSVQEVFDAIPHPEPFPLYLHAWWHQFVERLLPDIYVLFFILGCFIPIDITSVRRGYTQPSKRHFFPLPPDHVNSMLGNAHPSTGRFGLTQGGT